MNEQFRVSQKIGLMFRPGTAIPKDIKSWAITQLNAKSPALGISKSMPKSQVMPWPKSLQSDLKGRSDKLIRAAEVETIANRMENKTEAHKLINKSDFENYMGNNDHLKFNHRNIYGKDQVRLRFLTFWANHFTVAPVGDTTDQLVGSHIEDALLPNLNSSFSDMLYAAISHPGMLYYLDNAFSSGDKLNDNLGRELLELHTVSPTANYTENDIKNAAYVLSGWGYDTAKNKNYMGSFLQSKHKPGSKTVLGKTIQSGKEGLRQLTDSLANNSYAISFITKKLAEHFISENPSKSDINHIANAWKQSNGSLDQIHTAVIERAIDTKSPKFQWPMNWLFQVIRLSDATYIHGWDEIAGSCNHCNGNPKNDGSRKYPFMQNKEIFLELGQSFWHSRQPNGFSNNKESWISGEMFDRRIKFAEAIFNAGNPQFGANQIMDRIGAHQSTRKLVNSVGDTNEKNRFIALMCSPELMGLEYA